MQLVLKRLELCFFSSKRSTSKRKQGIASQTENILIKKDHLVSRNQLTEDKCISESARKISVFSVL